MGEGLVPVVERGGPRLLALARKSFPELHPAEERLFRNLGIATFGEGLPDMGDASRTLRADRLAWALLDPSALKLLTPLGIAVCGVNIAGTLRLNQCRANLRLQLDLCRFEEDIHLEEAHLAFVGLRGSRCRSVRAARLQVQDNVSLGDRAVFAGEVQLSGAAIGGDLECEGGTFAGPHGKALNAVGMRVEGSVLLRKKSSFTGEVQLSHAVVGQNLYCSGSAFNNAKARRSTRMASRSEVALCWTITPRSPAKSASWGDQ